jgi:[ribosomal protein S18]-alanine N-acetyltransferase
MHDGITAAKPDDLESILKLQAACGLSAWTADAYLAEFSRRDAIVLVSRPREGNANGFITGRIVAGLEGAEAEAEIYNIGVDPDAQNSGIGRRLLEHFVKKAELLGVAAIWLDVRESNFGAIGFYKRHGFQESGRRRKFYTSPSEDSLTMVRRRSGSADATNG